MGLSSSKTKTTSNTSQNTNQNETGTTTPIAPDWLTQAAQDYVGRIGAFGDMDPNGFVAPAAPLQQAAWQNAGSLGDWKGQAATAAGMARQAGGSGANLGGAMGRYASAAGLTPETLVSGAGPALATKRGTFDSSGRDMSISGGSFMGGSGPAESAGALKSPAHSTPLASPANAFGGPSSQQTAGLVSGQGYTMPAAQPGYAQPGYAMPRTGNPIGSASPPPAQTPSVDPLSGAEIAAPASLLTNLQAYQNPYTQDVVNASLADYDQQAARTQAQLAAQGARNGAFGGSRYGIAQGQLLADQDRGRASLDAGLRDQGFNAAAQLSQSDAANRQQASLANAAGGNQMTQFNAQQQDAALARQLQAAGLLGGLASDYGSGTRADLTTMGQLGDQQRAIEQAYAMAGPAQLQLMGQLSGMTPYDILVGRQVNGNTTGTMTGTGTSTTSSSPSLFNQLLAAGQAAAAFI